MLERNRYDDAAMILSLLRANYYVNIILNTLSTNDHDTSTHYSFHHYIVEEIERMSASTK